MQVAEAQDVDERGNGDQAGEEESGQVVVAAGKDVLEEGGVADVLLVAPVASLTAVSDYSIDAAPYRPSCGRTSSA